MSTKTFFIVPGFKMSPKHKAFKWLVTHLEDKGYAVHGVPITWERRTLDQNDDELKAFFQANKSSKNYILGFSYGAVITFMSANELKPEKVYLCSLSPDFKEDIAVMKPWIQKYIGKRRIESMKKQSARQIAKALTIPAVVFYGEKEGKQYPQLRKRCEETVKLANNSKLVVVKDAPHDLSYEEYVKAIKQEIK